MYVHDICGSVGVISVVVAARARRAGAAWAAAPCTPRATPSPRPRACSWWDPISVSGKRSDAETLVNLDWVSN